MKKLLILGASGAALIVSAAAIAQPAAQAPAAPKVHTRADVQARVTQHFGKLDANKDGFITRAELDARASTVAGKRARGAGNLFARLDANQDGTITRAEADAARAKAAQQRQDAPGAGNRKGGIFERFDSNKDGQITRAEFDSVRAQRGQSRGSGATSGRRAHSGHGFAALTGRMFDAADANRDGRVALQEATASALRHFDMADANRDGQITREERQQMRERMKAQRPTS